MELDWQKHYDSCRESAHGLAAKFLNLLFQYVMFSVGALTAIAYAHHRVHFSVAVAVGTVSIVTAFYFVIIINRYYSASRAAIQLCMELERKLFGDDASSLGVFSAVAVRGGRFYTSNLIKGSIQILVWGPVVAFAAVVCISLWIGSTTVPE